MASSTGAGGRPPTTDPGTTEPGTTDLGRPSAARRALQAAAALSLLAVGWQFVTAGQLVGTGQGLDLHGAGAVALHVTTGLAALAAALDLRGGGRPRVAALAVVLFGLTFLQAWSGDHAPLTVHVPLSLSVVVGAVVLLVVALVPRRRTG